MKRSGTKTKRKRKRTGTKTEINAKTIACLIINPPQSNVINRSEMETKTKLKRKRTGYENGKEMKVETKQNENDTKRQRNVPKRKWKRKQ